MQEPNYEVVEEVIRTLLLKCDAYDRRATAKRIAERFGFEVKDLTTPNPERG